MSSGKQGDEAKLQAETLTCSLLTTACACYQPGPVYMPHSHGIIWACHHTCVNILQTGMSKQMHLKQKNV